MNREEVDRLLKFLCDTTAYAVDFYVEKSGEPTDQMPEFVMSAAVACRLASDGVPAILEVDAETLRRRTGDTTNTVEAVIERLGRGKIDLVVLDPHRRQPIGFVEFKRWQYQHEAGDARRVADLLGGIPGAEFGVCVVMRDASADDLWHENMRQLLGEFGIVIVKDIEGRNRAGHRCCIACFAQLRLPTPPSA